MRKLHKSTAKYIEGKSRAVRAALALCRGKGGCVMPWEVEVACGGTGMNCHLVSISGSESWRTAPWIMGCLAACFCGEYLDLRLYGEKLQLDVLLEHIKFDKEGKCGCRVKLAVCGGVWLCCAPFAHDERQREKILAEFADGFTHVCGARSEYLLL